MNQAEHCRAPRDGGSREPAPVLHRAAWVVPVRTRPVRDGAVLVRHGRVLAVGPFARIRKEAPPDTQIADHGDSALMPALVNAHTHLELSAFKNTIPFPRDGFPAWLGVFIARRAGMSRNEIEEGFRAGERELLNSGTALYGDVTNEMVAVEPQEVALPERHVFFELLGFNCKSIAEAVPAGVEPDSARCTPTPHSVYSVSPEVIREAKERARVMGLPFSIHTAEHREELEFLDRGTGFCRELLDKLGKWNPEWIVPHTTPVRYLDDLGVLDRTTLLVHAVHMTGHDWATAARRGCTICFCPRSNRNLHIGRPDLEKALSCGIPAALGTDSLASNTDLDLFREAGYVMENYPSIRPDSILEMITSNPARALGRNADFGSIEAGGKAAILAVSVQAARASDLVEALLHSGLRGTWKWANPPRN